jgi:putative heme iron utilization protein
MNNEHIRQMVAFIRRHRQATLAVVDAGEPHTAMVSYVEEPDCSAMLIHLSSLSAHKRILLANPVCSLMICEPDDGTGEVMALARVALLSTAARIDRGGDEYARARQRFLEKLPSAEVMFALPDFDLFRVRPRRARFVAGFGRAFGVENWEDVTGGAQ